LLLAVLVSGTTVFAQTALPQHGVQPAGTADDVRTSFYARNDLEKKLQHEIVCTCGCGHTTIAECRKDPCGTAHELRGELAALIDQGKSHDEAIQWFLTKYGNQEMLGAPLDRGFNRLAWLFPYLLGATGALVIGFAATRWSHVQRTASEGPAADADLNERLDDELRNLD
jgi:cytochrome c-type biogenesis protein CcmH/NrfF